METLIGLPTSEQRIAPAGVMLKPFAEFSGRGVPLLAMVNGRDTTLAVSVTPEPRLRVVYVVADGAGTGGFSKVMRLTVPSADAAVVQFACAALQLGRGAPELKT